MFISHYIAKKITLHSHQVIKSSSHLMFLSHCISKEVERIFSVMQCSEVQKVRFGTHMLAEEADDWWVSLLLILEQDGTIVTWAVFRREFLDRYFPEDVQGKKEIEFLELKQGDMSVTEYAVKFVELAKFYPHYTPETAEFSKCIKFEKGLRADIKRAIGYQ